MAAHLVSSMKLATLSFGAALATLAAKLGLIVAFGYFLSDSQGDPHPNEYIVAALVAVTWAAVAAVVLGLVALLKGGRGWKLYLSFPLAALAAMITPFSYVVQ